MLIEVVLPNRLVDACRKLVEESVCENQPIKRAVNRSVYDILESVAIDRARLAVQPEIGKVTNLLQ
jgi:hypothetical protein